MNIDNRKMIHPITMKNLEPTPNPSQEGNAPHTPHQGSEDWHKEHCSEISDITLRNVNRMVAAERERYEDRMEEVSMYEGLHFVRESFKALEALPEKAEAYRLIARTIILLQDSDL